MDSYQKKVNAEVKAWKKRMQAKPSFTSALARKIQTKINRVIPEKVHEVITSAMKQMTRAVCVGAEFTAPETMQKGSLKEREAKVDARIKFYARTAAAEGAVTGAGGILLGLADFPILLAMKMKLLFDIAALYGHDVKDYRERIYLLYIFELAFSSQVHRRKIFAVVGNWDSHVKTLPDDINKFDWRGFQQEYRDYIDLAKMIQMIPGIGAVVGALVNHRLTNKLGQTAKNAYRMRRK